MLEQRLKRDVGTIADNQHDVFRVDFVRGAIARTVELASDEDGGVPSG